MTAEAAAVPGARPSALQRCYDAWCRMEARIAGTFLILMVVLIFAGGVARLLHYPLNWTTDLATCLFAWACFLAADVAWRNNSMMAIDVLMDRLPPRAQSALRLFNLALIVAFLLYLIGAGFYLTWVSRIRSFQGIPGVSYSWVTASLPAGAVLLLLTTMRRIMGQLRGERTESSAMDVL